MAGRKRIPDHLKVLQGTARKDRMNPNAPQPRTGVASAPEHLCERGAEVFLRISSILDELRLSAPADVDMLALLSQRIVDVENLTRAVQDGGFTYMSEGGLMKPNPAVTMRDAAMRQVQSLLNEFGLSPAARSKVAVAGEKEENPFAALG